MTYEEAVTIAIQEFFARVQELLATELPKATYKSGTLTKNILMELISHEGIVKEAYKDSKGVWTWGIGVTNASGHRVDRYKDFPTDLSHVIKIFKWLLETKYLPDVLKAFDKPLTETQLGAALSFHYNTGAIAKAQWVKSFNEGNVEKARQEFMNWRSPPEIIPRREAERDLFFEGRWTNDGKATVYTRVRKPSYTPDWSSATQVDISKEIS